MYLCAFVYLSLCLDVYEQCMYNNHIDHISIYTEQQAKALYWNSYAIKCCENNVAMQCGPMHLLFMELLPTELHESFCYMFYVKKRLAVAGRLAGVKHLN